MQAGVVNDAILALVARNSRTPLERSGDLHAQFACHAIAEQRLQSLCDRDGIPRIHAAMDALIAYGEHRMRAVLRAIPAGEYTAVEYLDGDGIDDAQIEIGRAHV